MVGFGIGRRQVWHEGEKARMCFRFWGLLWCDGKRCFGLQHWWIEHKEIAHDPR